MDIVKRTYVAPSRGRIMTHSKNLASPQQGNRSITDYMQDIKRNIEALAHINVKVDFDELSIRVLNGLSQDYCNISHALQVCDVPITFDELFEQLLSYEAQLKVSTPSPSLTPMTALVDPVGNSHNRYSNYHGGR